mmetsp:Transcript_42892/g.106993  ORF Transcript_42892/g.106993 Transcript_42892/m.106993 type:complete len:589 (+) Transcript_42892:917-2683(+)
MPHTLRPPPHRPLLRYSTPLQANPEALRRPVVHTFRVVHRLPEARVRAPPDAHVHGGVADGQHQIEHERADAKPIGVHVEREHRLEPGVADLEEEKLVRDDQESVERREVAHLGDGVGDDVEHRRLRDEHRQQQVELVGKLLGRQLARRRPRRNLQPGRRHDDLLHVPAPLPIHAHGVLDAVVLRHAAGDGDEVHLVCEEELDRLGWQRPDDALVQRDVPVRHQVLSRPQQDGRLHLVKRKVGELALVHLERDLGRVAEDEVPLAGLLQRRRVHGALLAKLDRVDRHQPRHVAVVRERLEALARQRLVQRRRRGRRCSNPAALADLPLGVHGQDHATGAAMGVDVRDAQHVRREANLRRLRVELALVLAHAVLDHRQPPIADDALRVLGAHLAQLLLKTVAQPFVCLVLELASADLQRWKLTLSSIPSFWNAVARRRLRRLCLHERGGDLGKARPHARWGGRRSEFRHRICACCRRISACHQMMRPLWRRSRSLVVLSVECDMGQVLAVLRGRREQQPLLRLVGRSVGWRRGLSWTLLWNRVFKLRDFSCLHRLQQQRKAVRALGADAHVLATRLLVDELDSVRVRPG